MYPKTFLYAEYGNGDVILWCFDRPCVKAGSKLYVYETYDGHVSAYVVTNRLPLWPFVMAYTTVCKDPDGIIRAYEWHWEGGNTLILYRVSTRETLEASRQEYLALHNENPAA